MVGGEKGRSREKHVPGGIGEQKRAVSVKKKTYLWPRCQRLTSLGLSFVDGDVVLG